MCSALKGKQFQRIPENKVKEDLAMSVQPTRLVRAGLLAAAASLVVMPSAAVADDKQEKAEQKQEKSELKAHQKQEKSELKDKQKQEKQELKEHQKEEKDQLKNEHKQEKKDKSDDSSETPAPVAAQAPSTAAPAPQTVVLPPCTSNRYFKIKLGKRKNIRRARVLLNGKTVSVSYGKRRVKARIDLRGRVKGTYMVTSIVVTKKNRIKTRTRTYRVCGG